MGPSGLVTTYVDSVIVLKPIAGIKSIGVAARGIIPLVRTIPILLIQARE